MKKDDESKGNIARKSLLRSNFKGRARRSESSLFSSECYKSLRRLGLKRSAVVSKREPNRRHTARLLLQQNSYQVLEYLPFAFTLFRLLVIEIQTSSKQIRASSALQHSELTWPGSPRLYDGSHTSSSQESSSGPITSASSTAVVPAAPQGAV